MCFKNIYKETGYFRVILTTVTADLFCTATADH
jgi:hypothetical protein